MEFANKKRNAIKTTIILIIKLKTIIKNTMRVPQKPINTRPKSTWKFYFCAYMRMHVVRTEEQEHGTNISILHPVFMNEKACYTLFLGSNKNQPKEHVKYWVRITLKSNKQRLNKPPPTIFEFVKWNKSSALQQSCREGVDKVKFFFLHLFFIVAVKKIS